MTESDKEVMQQALAALEGVLDDDKDVLKASISGGLYEVVDCQRSIASLRAAIAQSEQTAPVRQPLSDDDIWDIYLPYALSVRHRKSEIQFARAIEAAHGIAQPKDKP